DPKEIGQVSIIKNKREMEILNTPSMEPLSIDLSTTTISKEEIRRTASKTVIESMAYSPGVFIETRGRKVKQFFSVRGQKYPYPEYSINGVWQREFHETPYFFSSANVEKIEIIRSSAALLHGLSGMAGIVNIVTKKYSKPETIAELEYGSFNSSHTFLSHSGQQKSLNYSFNLGYDKTDGSPGQHAKEKILNTYGTLEWNPSDKVSITANIFHLNGMRQFMQAQYPAAASLIGRLESYDPFISSTVSLKASVRQNERSSLEIQSYYTNRRPEFNNEVTGITETEYDSEVGVNILESISLGKSNILRFGALYNHWNAPNGKRFYVGRKSELQTISGVITDEQDFGKLNINGGLRWVKTYINEFGAFNIDGSGSAFVQVNPIKDEWQPYTLQMTGGAVYSLNKQSMISLNMVSGSIKPREGSLDETLNRPENEFRTMVDLGYKISGLNNSSIVLTGFYVNQKNAIIYSGDIIELEQGRIAELYENVDQFQYGIELEANSPRMFKRSTNLFFNLTGMKSMLKEENENIKNSELPELIFNTGLNVRLYDIDLNLYTNYSSEFFSTRFADKSVEPVSLGGYFRIDLNMGYSFGNEDNWRIYCSIKDLSDVNYSTVVGYPDPGRRINMGINYHFRGKNK
ncbi:MAG: TonB-dependent receptor plug domain-containing protein, partial [Bacteroidales bacterium]|nr:TonB-dependent receptor plug domain-containing protein [Bacteroidales bacterium]